MNLYVDIGNSRIKWVFAEDGIPGEPQAWDYSPDNMITLLDDQWGKITRPDRILVANVAGDRVSADLNKVCDDIWSLVPEFIRVRKEACGVTNGYLEINQLGVDRWLSIIAGWVLYKTNICIIGVGTAVTVDLVLASGQHQGGYIIPGMNMMQHMLTRHTHGIDIECAIPPGIEPGQSTRACVQNGSMLALIAMIERVVSDFRQRFPDHSECIITGGGATGIIPMLNTELKHEPDLVLRGIGMLSKGMKG